MCASRTIPPQNWCSDVWVGEVAVILLDDRAPTAHLPLKDTPAHLSDLKWVGTITPMTWLVEWLVDIFLKLHIRSQTFRQPLVASNVTRIWCRPKKLSCAGVRMPFLWPFLVSQKHQTIARRISSVVSWVLGVYRLRSTDIDANLDLVCRQIGRRS
jgi:hypothetical protein